MPSPLVVYDACVLFPPSLRDLLLRIAVTGLVRARWSEQILDEVFDNVIARRPDLDPARLERTRRLMCQAVPDCVVVGYEQFIDDLVLPDADDRHVLAAAIHCGARSIVTANLRDFPAEVLGRYEIEALHPDAFVQGLIDRAGRVVCRTIQEQAAALRSPPMEVGELLDRLSQAGLPRSVERVRRLVDVG